MTSRESPAGKLSVARLLSAYPSSCSTHCVSHDTEMQCYLSCYRMLDPSLSGQYLDHRESVGPVMGPLCHGVPSLVYERILPKQNPGSRTLLFSHTHLHSASFFKDFAVFLKKSGGARWIQIINNSKSSLEILALAQLLSNTPSYPHPVDNFQAIDINKSIIYSLISPSTS